MTCPQIQNSERMNVHSIYCGNAESNYNWLNLGKRRTQGQRSRYETRERLQWRDRNQIVIRRLSDMLGAWPQDIEDFLYDLSLKKYYHLLNPKECGWNFCKVPLCYPNVCDRYMGIFDRSGNLRDPTHPKCLIHLLQLLQDYLNGACMNGCLGLPIHAQYAGGRPPTCPRFRRVYHEPEIDNIDDHNRESLASLGRTLPSVFQDQRKFSIATRESQIPIESPSSSPRMSVDRQNDVFFANEVDKNMRSKTKIRKAPPGRHSVFLNDELALAHNQTVYNMEDLVRGALERPRNRTSYVGPIGNLRNERVRILIKQLVEKKGRKIDPEELKRIIERVDLGPNVERKRQKEIALEISRLYSSIVQTRMGNSVSQYLTPGKPKLSVTRHPKRSLPNYSITIHEPRESSKPYRKRSILPNRRRTASLRSNRTSKGPTR